MKANVCLVTLGHESASLTGCLAALEQWEPLRYEC